jgi:hypothetical protein
MKALPKGGVSCSLKDAGKKAAASFRAPQHGHALDPAIRENRGIVAVFEGA